MAIVQPALARPSGLAVLTVALVAGGVAAVVEMVPVLPIQNALGNRPVRVFQSIASGLLGRAAFHDGAGSALLGVALHLLISVVAALVYGVAAMRFAVLVRRPLLAGLALGAAAYGVMTWGVLPLSAVPFHGLPPPPMMALSIGIHLLFFGVPIALVTARLRSADA